jgi:hypothetical protein
MRRIPAHSCSIGVAVGKDQTINLPRMGATDLNVVHITVSNLPPRRYMHRVSVICGKPDILDFVKVQRHVQSGSMALWTK